MTKIPNIKEEVHSQNNKLSAREHLKQEFSLRRLKRSNDIPGLQQDFTIGKAIGGGDCFFDAVVQGLKQLKPDMKIDVKSLRRVLKEFIVNDQQLEDEIGSKVIRDAKNSNDPTIIPPAYDVADYELWNAYLASIEYTSEYIEKIKISNPSLYQSLTLTRLRYGSTLQVPIWGRPDIEGYIICKKYNVKLHVIEKQPIVGWSHQILGIDESDGKFKSKSINNINYNDANTIHVINRGSAHFEPILKVREIDLHDINTAVEDSDLDKIKGLLKKGIDINTRGRDSKTPLHNAVKTGRLYLIQYLVKNGAAINVVDSNGETILHTAVSTKKLDIVRYLIDHGCTINCADKYGKTPLYLAIQGGNVELVELLIEKGADFKSPDNYGKTPLHLAAHSGNLDLVKLLIGKGADFKSPDNYGKTPLHLAAHSGNLDLVKLLIEKGTDFKSPDDYGKTPLHLAAHSGNLDLVKLLIEKGADVTVKDKRGQTPLHLAAQSGNVELVKLLIEKGADFKSSDKDGNTPLHLAVSSGKLNIIKLLIEKGADFKSSDKDGNTPLHLAVSSGKLNIIKLLIEKGADVTAKDKRGQTPLHWAAHWSKLDVVKLLIEKGADFNAKDMDGKTPLHRAARHGELDVVKYFIEEKEADFTVKDKGGKTPLHFAAESGKLDIVKLLIEKGADVTVKGKRGQTPLHEAAERSNWNVVKLLIEKGADFNAKDMDGKTPLHLAARRGELDIVRYLIEEKGVDFKSPDNYGKTPLYLAARRGELDTVKYLIEEKGADFNAKDMDGQTPLHEAVHDAAGRANWDVVKLLIEKGADFKSPDRYGNTPLHGAARYGELDIVKYLIEEKREDFKSPDKYGRTPLHLAAQSGNLDLVELLIKKGADFKSPDMDGNTPLHGAAQSGNWDVVKLLIKKGADFKSPDKDGKTPLHWAAQWGKLDVVKLLIEKGADFKSPDKDGKTPLHLAVSSGKLDVVKLLIEKGADFNAKDMYGKTPLRWAAQRDKLDIVKLLIEKGADFKSSDNYGKTPLHDAVFSGKLDGVKLLIEKGADVTVKDKGEKTPLHDAVFSGKLNVVKLLIEKGADFKSPDKNGKTLLHEAAERSNFDILDIVKYLIEEKGADFTVKDKDGKTPLHYAAESYNLDGVKLLIEKGADFNAKDMDGKTPLHDAAERANWDVVKLLIKKGADVTVKDKHGQAPLHEAVHNAARWGNLDVVKLLIEKGADFKSPDMDGNTPLHFAAESGKLDTVKYLIEEKGADFKSPDNYGKTPLDLAARQGELDIVKYLIEEKGADFKSPDKDGKIPLHLAAQSGNLDLVELLIEKGADFNAKDMDGKTLLHLVAGRQVWKGLDIVKYLIEEKGADFIVKDKDGNTPLHDAAYSGKLDIVKYLIEEKGADVNVKDKDGNTPLHDAAYSGKLDIVKYLIEKGDDVNQPNNDGNTPLHFAAEEGYLYVVKYFIEEKGADVTVKDKDGKTPLHFAAERSHLNIVKLLIEKGADFKSPDNYGKTPLHEAVHDAAERDNWNVVKLLIEKGADVTVKDKRGQTPLHEAVHDATYWGKLDVVKLLIEKGADFKSPDKDGNTPLHWAAKEGYLDIVKYLIEEKGDNINVNAKNSQNQTPLQLAVQESHVGVVEALLNKEANVEIEDVELAKNEEIKEIVKQKLQVFVPSECPPSTSSGRRRREIGNCELSWNSDIEKIREGEENIRSLSNLKINSDKFIAYIKDESISENKRTQLIQLAEQVPITGQSQGLVNKLISNQKFINHLSKIGMISGITMQGMMAKNVLADAFNGNYQGLAINLGFIALPFGVKAGENAALEGLHSASEIAYARGFKLAPLVESSLAQSFKVSSSFLARSTSAFIAYDLYRSVKELRNGTEEALVSVVGDSVYLGVDAAELGIEFAEGFGVLEGVSSVTGPIGATIGAVVFVGTDVYQAVKKVENIDRLVHLTAEERLLEGIRAFIGIGTEKHIEELIEEKQLYNQLVTRALEYLKQHSDIQRYVFPTEKLVVDNCKRIEVPLEKILCGKVPCSSFSKTFKEECTTKFQPDSDNTVILDEQKPDIKWSKIRPDNPPEGNLFCILQGHGQLVSGLSYSCNNAIGIEYSSNRKDNYTLIDLGDGTDIAIGFNNSSNIFLIGNGYKTISGGEKDDTFILQGNRFEGKISGGNGTNTLDLSKFSPQSKSLFLSFRGNNLPTLGGLIDQISKVITRENKEDIISCKDVTLKYIDGRGGRNEHEQDVITIEFDSCQKLFGTTIDCRDYLSGKFTPKVQIMLRDYTTVNNYASKGNFSYFVDQKKGKASVDILSTSKNEFIFNNTLENIKAIDFNSSVDIRTVKFTFSPHNTETLISYGVRNISFTLNDGTVISVSKEGNLYALQNSNKSVDEIINSYSAIANNLKISIFVHSLLNNESIVVGHGKHDVIENNPEYKSHLIGNGGENIFVVTSDKLPIPEIVLYDVDQENKIDTLDLRKIRKQVENVKVKTRIITSGKDLIIQLFYEKDNEVSESNIVQVRLKDGLLTNWYERLHVIMNHVPMKIEEFELRPLPLVFDNNEEIIRIAAEDIDKNNKIIISQKIEDYTFSKLENDLIMTFNNNASLILSEFYKNKEMETLTIRFANKEVTIKDELNNVRSFDDLKEEYRNNTANIINSFNNSTEATEASNSTETSVKSFIRNRRNIESNVKSAASRPTSFINTIVNAFTNAIIGTVQGIISARTSAGYSTQCHEDKIADKPSNYKSSVNGYKPESSISQVDAQTDINSTILLLDLLIRRVTGQKYISTVDQSISPLEAQGYALNITNRFEKVLNKTAIKSGISLTNLNLDPVAVQSAIVRKIINGRFSEIAKTLYSFAKEACPEFKQTDKFLVHLRSQLEGEKVLQQKVEKPYKDLSQEVSRKVELSKKPDTFLNGTSVVKGISRGIN